MSSTLVVSRLPSTTTIPVARTFRSATILMFVAAVSVSSAAANPSVASEDVPVPGGIIALARALGIDPIDRARCVAELTRLVYADPADVAQRQDSLSRRLVDHFEGLVRRPSTIDRSRDTDLVPMPLSARVWSQAVFRRPVAREDLFAAVMSNPAAALIARGLAALDDETLRFLAEHPSVVTRLYERHASVFAAFAAQLRIRDGRVVPPGGDRAAPLWEALLRQKVTHPEDFVRELFARDHGRLAYLYDTIGYLDPPRAAFALGLWIEPPSLRVERFLDLAHFTSELFSDWDVERFPFWRPAYDLLSMFLRVNAAATGEPAPPALRWMWRRALATGELPAERVNGADRPGDERPIDAAWLAATLLPGHSRARLDRLDQFAFGQRIFAEAAPRDVPDLVVAIQGLPRYRMLMLTLDRLGVRRAALYANLARQAERLAALDAVRARPALAQFQGAIAVVAHLARVNTIDRATAEALLGTIASLPFDRERGYAGAFAPWLQSRLHPVLCAADGSHDVPFEELLLAALVGPPERIPTMPLAWEGQQYLFDYAGSEINRMRRARERQGNPSIDAGLHLYRTAQQFRNGLPEAKDIQDAIGELNALPADGHLGPLARKTLDKLVGIRGSRDPVRAALVADPLLEIADGVLGEALLAVIYAVHWGDPQGAARRARHVARRHDFGLATTYRDTRVRTAWAVPKQVFERGMPWRVEGAVLGLDVALAPLALRRVNAEPPPVAPVLTSTERETFVTSLGLMDPFTLQDAARDAITDAIARGRRRVASLAETPDDLPAVIRELAMDGWRIRALQWTVAHEASHVESLFSMTDFLYLGGGRDLDLHPWGMSAMSARGCLCLVMPSPGLYAALAGRPQLGLLATTVADLNLRVAVVLRELGLPAALAKTVLAAALQDFVDEVRPSHADDWLTLARTAQRVPRERIEDYVAAAAAGGPLVAAPSHAALPTRRP